MLRFGKRFGIWALCICLLCTLPVTAFAEAAEDCPGECAHQAAIGTTHYDTVAEAFEAAADGDTVTLLTDLSTAALTVDKAITLDLGGMTVTGENTAEEALITATKDLTVTGGTLLTENGAVLLVMDAALSVEESASVQGGDAAMGIIVRSVDAEACAFVSGEVITTSGDAAVVTVSDNGMDCDLYIDTTAVITSEGNAIEMYDGGKLEITGGTITAKENTVVMDVYEGLTMEASVTGGYFTAENGELFVITAGTDATAPEDFVTGGTFNKDPSAFVPDTHQVKENDDGTYTVTVIPSYLITFDAGSGYGTMDSIRVSCGESITLPQCGFTHDSGVEFAGWDIDGTTYAVGDTFTPVSDTVITALWNTHEHYGGYATCISPAICEGCGSPYGDYGSHELTSAGGYDPTCDSNGMLYHSQCVHCGICFVDGVEVSSFSLTIPSLGHQWKSEKAKAATCTEAGIQEHRLCTVCGAIEIDGSIADESELTIPALGHTMKTVSAVPSTCTQAGVKAHSHCTTCGKYFLQNKEVTPAQLTTELASHVLGSDWHGDDTYHWKNCVDCDEVFLQSKHKDANADTLCDDCGAAVTVTNLPAEAEEEAAKEGNADKESKDGKENKGLYVLFLIPILIAAIIAIYSAVERYKRKKRRKMRQMRKMK